MMLLANIIPQVIIKYTFVTFAIKIIFYYLNILDQDELIASTFFDLSIEIKYLESARRVYRERMQDGTWNHAFGNMISIHSILTRYANLI